MDLLIYNAAQLVTISADGADRKVGEAMRDLRVIEDGAVGITDGRISFVGKSDDVRFEDAESTINAMGQTVLPGFVDSHTHLVFAGSRERDFAQRIAGATYAEIAESGGGINTTVRATRAASQIELTEYALHRLDECLSWGSTTVEIKSGYGLNREAELRMLDTIRSLQDLHVVELVPTFLGAHTVPFDYKERREEYLTLLLDDLLPEVARRDLAEFCDVFAERTAFTIDEARAVLQRARDLGLDVRVHADQITCNGGAELSAEFHAASADHLDHASDEALRRMAEAGVVSTLLPGVSLFLGEPWPDARRFIAAGLPVAIATDMNPGSCMSENMQLMISLATMRMHMTVEEALVAATLNAAAALRRGDRIGSLEVGKQADLLIFDVPNYMHVPYHFGVNSLVTVVKKGRVVLEKRYANA